MVMCSAPQLVLGLIMAHLLNSVRRLRTLFRMGVLLAGAITTSTLVFCSMAGFAFQAPVPRPQRAGAHMDYTLVLAGTAMVTLPVLIVFAVFGRRIIGGIMEGR
jgi:ABC-type glycerol-3-phosphate transport system permease component